MAVKLPSYEKFIKPFAYNGDKSVIPQLASSAIRQNLASFELGFPKITAMPMADGGIPPERIDFNALGYICTSVAAYLQQGGLFQFDSELSGLIGGYPQGAVLNYIDADNGKIYRLMSMIENNTYDYTSNPEYIGQYWQYIDDNSSSSIGKGIGEVFTSISSKTPIGAVPLTGELISECDTKFPAFWNWLSEQSSGGYIRTLTATEYQKEIAAYGMSGGFVIDENAKTVQLPQYSNAFLMGSNGSNNGSTIGAGLPNIKGEIQASQINNGGTTDGAFFFVKRVSYGAENYDGGSSHWIGFDASLSNPIYGNSNTVQPPAIATNYYMQVMDVQENITAIVIAKLQEAINKASTIQYGENA